MKKLTLGISALALAAVAGVAIAADAPARMNHGRMAETTTRAEAQTRAEEMFTRFDVNKDGKIDEADRAAHRAQMFDKIDTNKDGNISRDEFAAAHPRGHGDAPPPPPGAQGMRMEHGQGDGKGRGMGGHMGRRGHGMMGKMPLRGADTNGDKAITKPELVAAALKHFDAADANKDGKLTPDERRSAMRSHMQHMRGGMGGHGMGDMPKPQ